MGFFVQCSTSTLYCSSVSWYTSTFYSTALDWLDIYIFISDVWFHVAPILKFKNGLLKDSFKAEKKICQWILCVIEVEEPVISEGQKSM